MNIIYIILYGFLIISFVFFIRSVINLYSHNWIKINKEYIKKEIKDEHLLEGFMRCNRVEICDHCGLIRTFHKFMDEFGYIELGYLNNYKRTLRRYNRLINRIDEENKEIIKRRKKNLRETNIDPTEIFDNSFYKAIGITKTWDREKGDYMVIE